MNEEAQKSLMKELKIESFKKKRITNKLYKKLDELIPNADLKTLERKYFPQLRRKKWSLGESHQQKMAVSTNQNIKSFLNKKTSKTKKEKENESANDLKSKEPKEKGLLQFFSSTKVKITQENTLDPVPIEPARILLPEFKKETTKEKVDLTEDNEVKSLLEKFLES